MNNKPRPYGEIPKFLIPRLGRSTPRRFEYGLPVPVGLFGRQLLLTDPDDVFHVLVANAANYTKSRELSSKKSRSRVGGGLLGRQGSTHHDRRRNLQPLFTSRAVDEYALQIEKQCHWLLNQWIQGQTRDLASDIGCLTRRILLTSVFGEVSDAEIALLEKAISARRIHTEKVYFSRVPHYGRLPTISRRGDRQAQKVFLKFVQRSLRDIRAGRLGGGLLHRMSRILLADGGVLPDSDIADEVLSLMSTGHETITEWLTWCWVLLGTNPDFQRAWRLELDQLGTLSEVISLSAENAPLTQGLLDESLRLYPPTWLFARVPIKKDQLKSGVTVAAGQNLLLCPYLMHRHPEVFPEPERFIPLRFQELRRNDIMGRTYFPFGAGAHRCIGDKFARLETLVLLVTIARASSIEPIRKHPVIPNPGLTMSVRGGWPVKILGTHK
ncbi:MAG: cytochrome P450 [Planctomycetaceae bacterium]|nr:cytochrome P450 [Planctomycetaceae bacterium]